jgi:hypothetical protein
MDFDLVNWRDMKHFLNSAGRGQVGTSLRIRCRLLQYEIMPSVVLSGKVDLGSKIYNTLISLSF